MKKETFAIFLTLIHSFCATIYESDLNHSVLKNQKLEFFIDMYPNFSLSKDVVS